MKKKLQLNELKVQSFVTGLNDTGEVKGGSSIVTDCTTPVIFTMPVEFCVNNPTYHCPTRTVNVSNILAECP